jgi:hypothetical protein
MRVFNERQGGIGYHTVPCFDYVGNTEHLISVRL